MSKKPKRLRYQISRYFWGAASWFLETVSYLPFLSRIRKETITVTNRRIPAGFDGFSIALISDLHGHFFGKKQERLIQAVKDLSPDIVVMAGDWAREEYAGEDKKAIDALIEGLAPVFPFYGSMGNHEFTSDMWLSDPKEEQTEEYKGTAVPYPRRSHSRHSRWQQP